MDCVRVKDVHVIKVHNPQSDQKLMFIPKPVNNIWIYDRSGSMTYLLPELAEDLIAHSKKLPVGDTLTLGWFSTEGEFRFILVGHTITPTSYDVIEKMIRSACSPIALTCFSDILMDTENVINNLSAFGNDNALMFFTDGYPVVEDYNKELAKIFYALERIKGSIGSSLMVGYGGWYNRELMGKMTRTLGGTLIHASKLADFTTPMGKFSGKNQKPMIKLPVPDMENAYGVFYFNNGNVVNCPVDKKGWTATIPENTSDFYVVGIPQEKVPPAQCLPFDSMLDGIYGAAIVCNQDMKTDVAIDLMTMVGDTAIVDALDNAWTNAEHGAAEKLIAEGLDGKKYTKGKHVGYVTKDNAFCLVNLIDELLADSEAMFYPFDPEWHYQRIGVKRVTKEGYPKFTPIPNQGCRFGTFNWNQTRLNLSALARIEGFIPLDERAEGLGFSKNFPTYVWRNYTIVKDGVLNITSMFCTMSKDTFDLFWMMGVIDTAIWNDAQPVEVHFDRVPMVNRAMASPAKLLASELCAQIWRETTQQAYMKVIKYLQNILQPEKPVSTFFTQEQNDYLASFGITSNGFNPPSEEAESVDFYWAKEFDVKLAGFSSLPKIADVIMKLASKKSLTASQQLIADAYVEINDKMTDDAKLDLLTLQGEYLKHNAILKDVRQDKQRTMFSVLLAKKWFSDLTTRDGALVTDAEGHQYTFSIRDVKCEY